MPQVVHLVTTTRHDGQNLDERGPSQEGGHRRPEVSTADEETRGATPEADSVGLTSPSGAREKEPENEMELKDLRVVVTGAASGMGAHFARRFHALGAQVAAGDVNEALLAELPEGIHRRKLDVSSEADCEAFVGWAADAMGGINGLVNNAGIIRDGLLVKKHRETGELTKLPLEQLRSVLDVNLVGATLMARECAAKMIAAGERGVIVNISSIARHGSRGQTNYVAAKAALAANTVTWMRELSAFGIRVGAIAPGMIETPMTRGMNQKARDALVATIPVGRIGEPEDIFQAVRFVVECDFFTGRTIDVDGGSSMG